MPEFLVNFNVLDVLIILAVVLAVYLIYVYTFDKNTNDYGNEPHPVLEEPNNNKVNESSPVHMEMRNNNILSNNNDLREENSPSVVPEGKEKLRAANKKGDHMLLDQSKVKPKSNYICNKECPCDERTIGESLEDIRKQFLSPTKSFYGNVYKSFGVSLHDGFKASDGKEHKCHVKAIDEDTINSVLGCEKKYNLNVNNLNETVNANLLENVSANRNNNMNMNNRNNNRNNNMNMNN